MLLSDIIKGNSYEAGIEVCPGCDNHCTVKSFLFANGKTFYSGNQCERVYSSSAEKHNRGVNMFVEKNRMLWRRAMKPETGIGLRIGIPRGLGIYEDFPFWCTLLTESGIEVVLSKGSSNKLYEKGIRTIVADNICFPAKLMHGHIMDLIEQKVDRILYPWVVFERKEDKDSGNSYNCPIVSGYADVIRSSIDPERRYGMPFDSPVVNFENRKLLERSCCEYLSGLGIKKSVAMKAVERAIDAQRKYVAELERRATAVLQKAISDGRMVILLASRPYHADPLIEHKVSQSIADMGIDVITENVATHAGSGVYRNINALSQWAYPNRIFKAAWFVGQHPYPALHMMQLTSFGCGPDAFILDEVRGILDRHNKNLTVLKIDDVNNIGSLRLRIRSLVDSASLSNNPVIKQPSDQPFTTKPFTDEDRRRTILAPFFAEGYSEYLTTIFQMMGYKLVSLPMANHEDAEQGLREANNDICYPATLVVGSLMRALKSGKYDLSQTAVAITQTGGQCRASNYYSLIKNAMVRAGFADVPVVSVGVGYALENTQPGFAIPWKKVWRIILYAMFFADSMQKMYYSSIVREKEKGNTQRVYDKYTSEALKLIAANNPKALVHLAKEAATAFAAICDKNRKVERVGLVGEIYVKYNSFSNKNVVRWLIEHDIEVVPPALSGFFLSMLPNVLANRKLHIKEPSMPDGMARLIDRAIMFVAGKFDKACSGFPHYRTFTSIFENYRLSNEVINPAADFGEGWFLPGEICHLAESGINKVVSVQPFGCIANHIISKGIEKRLKERYPKLSLLFLDFDSGTSEANVQNRLHFMLEN
ncbi:MAG: acyl-CoA dehydratase activase-related protein [Bacteroidales bacterium]|nr:acyl-CoA dehydratase activase-related protein [Bacteroidales bacterium]